MGYTPKQKRAAGGLSSQYSMISILALKNLAQYQLLANSYALRNIFQIFAAAAIEFYPANSRHFQALVCPGAAGLAVECNSLLQRGPYRCALDVRPDLIRGGIDGPHDLHIPLCLKLLDRLGLCLCVIKKQ